MKFQGLRAGILGIFAVSLFAQVQGSLFLGKDQAPFPRSSSDAIYHDPYIEPYIDKMEDYLYNLVTSKAQQLKNASVPLIRVKLNQVIPNFEQNIRTTKKSLETSLHYINTIMEKLKIPEQKTLAEAQFQVKHLEEEIKKLKEKRDTEAAKPPLNQMSPEQIRAEVMSASISPSSPGLYDYFTTKLAELKSAIVSKAQAAKEASVLFLRRQTLQTLDSLLPGFEENLRMTNQALDSSSYYTHKIMKILAIPEKASVSELDAQIARLSKELTDLKAELPQLTTKPDTSIAIPIPGPSIEEIFFKFPKIRQQQELETQEKLAQQEKKDIEDFISAIEKASQDRTEEGVAKTKKLQNDLKLLLETGNINIELFTENQKKRSGLGADFFNNLLLELELLKQKASKNEKMGEMSEMTKKKSELENQLAELKFNLLSSFLRGGSLDFNAMTNDQKKRSGIDPRDFQRLIDSKIAEGYPSSFFEFPENRQDPITLENRANIEKRIQAIEKVKAEIEKKSKAIEKIKAIEAAKKAIEEGHKNPMPAVEEVD